MGFRVTLLSIPLWSSDAVLRSLGLNAGDEPDPVNDSPVSGVVNGNGYLVWANNDWLTITNGQLLDASRHGDVLMLRANETIMISEAAKFENGEMVWSVIHDCNEGRDHLVSTGSPPAIWQKIRDDLLAAAAADGDDDVDFIYDAPVVLFHHLSGFRHDEGPDLPFVALKHEHATKAKKPFWKFW
jgi:hypothetical protein